ncbi:hypothetical protein B296_00058464 [Ensete ventricosum]|uniref:Uncharacterized protein n=1 Tax=Ensete ventricosum TaxID=4639 RepID=A0A426WXJ1_ENSVE|nr:hypothetical protein B296_00058464 [Ensete ventricosum]
MPEDTESRDEINNSTNKRIDGCYQPFRRRLRGARERERGEWDQIWGKKEKGGLLDLIGGSEERYKRADFVGISPEAAAGCGDPPVTLAFAIAYLMDGGRSDRRNTKYRKVALELVGTRSQQHPT